MLASPATGCLYLVGTPIGNLEDITLRALRILKEADQIACEDTRHTQKLLSHYEISKPLVSYHEHNEMTRAPELVVAMEQGAKIALVSDAGMPLVSDPGYRLVTLCARHQIPVIPIPGPSALLAALSASGLPNEEFLFVGFLPARTGERRRALERLRIEDRTLILYEAPHRVAETIADAREILGDRPACLARERHLATTYLSDFRSALTALRCASKHGVALLAEVGKAIEHSAHDVHPVVDVNEIHHWHNQQRHAWTGSVARSAGQTGHSRTHQEVRECPLIARGPEFP